MTILDVGCGPGSITVDMARLVPRGYVTGVEHVSDPLEEARTLATVKCIRNVSFMIGDIHCLPFEDNTFDVVHTHQVLQHVHDPVKALQEMRRVAKAGGLIACRESASMIWYPQSSKLDLWYSFTTRMALAKGGNPHPGRFIHVWAERAGFRREDITKSTGSWCFSSDEEREYWGGSIAQRSRSSESATLAVDGGFVTTDQLDEVAQGWDEFCADGDAWFGLLHGEILCRKAIPQQFELTLLPREPRVI